MWRSGATTRPDDPTGIETPSDIDADAFGFRSDTPATFVTEGIPSEAADLARRTVAILREAFGVRHPHLLGYQASGPNAELAGLLGISRSAQLQDAQIWAHSSGLDLEAVAGLMEQAAVALAQSGKEFHR